MIYTLTLNPALDHVMQPEELALGQVVRCVGDSVTFGGKGINVSVVLHRLGTKSTALGFIAGEFGKLLERMVNAEGVTTDFITLSHGNTRMNVKLKTDPMTELNAPGPDIDEDALSKLFIKLDTLDNGDTLVLAGSVPPSLPDDIYEQIMRRLSGKNVRIVVDAGGSLLLNSLRYRPFLIKPNADELQEAAGVSTDTLDGIIAGANKLSGLGAQNVLVSLGENGALLYDSEGNTEFSPAPKGKVINTVGAGDSMLAGFLAGIESDKTDALKYGIAAGSATAFSEKLAEKDEIIKLYEKL